MTQTTADASETTGAPAAPQRRDHDEPGGRSSPSDGGRQSVERSKIDAAIEAILVSVDRPIPAAKIAEPLGPLLQETPWVATPVGPAEVEAAIDRLNDSYDREGRAFRIEPISGGFRLMTRPEYAPVIAAMHRARASTRLSRPALETLAIIAYRQPMTRAELEAIRGVACGEVLRSLLDRRMIRITGRAEELGRPMLYGTTPQFLDAFGLAAIKDLPKPEELADRLEHTQDR